MAKKPTVTTISSGYASTTTLNSNFEALRDGFDNTLSLDGSTPNAMGADLDMDGNDILNAGSIIVGGSDYLAQAKAARDAAQTAQTAAETAETNAETSETNAATSASSASTSASNAATSASQAASSAVSASGSATAAAASVVAAESAEVGAEAAETNAAASETAAATSETNAATSATNAASSATAAAGSASTASAASDAALAALDSFDDRYLGQKASDPTLDNDGDALVAGALYFNTTDDVMKVYEGSTWVAAYASLSGALLQANNLSDLASVSASRNNLGLGTAATTASTDYATAAQGTLADSAVQPNDSPTFNGLTVDNDGATVLTVDRATSDGVIIDVQKGGSSVGSIKSAFSSSIAIDGAANRSGVYLATSSLVPRYNASNIDATVDLGGTSTRFKDLYLSGGVYLGGTGSANKLDDYEEGTWTPYVIGASSTGTTIYNTNGQKGGYTKIGNLVTLTFYVSWSAMTGTGGLRVIGMPFALAGNTSNDVSAGNCMTSDLDMPNGTNNLTLVGADVDTFLRIFSSIDAGGIQQVLCDAGGATVWGQFTYRANA